MRVAGSLFYRAEGEVAPATLRGGGPAGALVAPVSAGRPEEVDAARVRPVDGRGRAAAHRAGTLVELAPGAQRRFATKITARPAEPPSEGKGT